VFRLPNYNRTYGWQPRPTTATNNRNHDNRNHDNRNHDNRNHER